MKYTPFFLCMLLIFNGCRQKPHENLSPNSTELLYAKQIQIRNSDSILTLNSGGKITEFDLNILPLKSAMLVPSSINAYLDELGLINLIKGVSEPNYIFNEKVKKRIKEGEILTIGNYNELFIEIILTNKPDILISTSNPNLAKFHDQLEKNGIKIIYIDEYLEENPLGKAEYIKIFGELFGKREMADSIFSEIETRYHQIKTKIKTTTKNQPTILANGMYGDIWYMPGGKSFQAKFFTDAGGDYLWKDNNSSSVLNLTFEEVFEKANDADIWLNAGDFNNLESFASSFKNYQWFSAFKNKHIYNWEKRKNERGANDYFETGTIRPDLVLKDLAYILHPELFPKHELFFYKKLE